MIIIGSMCVKIRIFRSLFLWMCLDQFVFWSARFLKSLTYLFSSWISLLYEKPTEECWMICSLVASMLLRMAEDAVKLLQLVPAVLTILILLPLLEPPCFLKRLIDTVLPNNSRLRLECTFTGAPKMFLTWYKDGKQLYASYRYNIKVTENSSILECLHECNKETPGKYSCEVSNSYGIDICHANVTTVTGS